MHPPNQITQEALMHALMGLKKEEPEKKSSGFMTLLAALITAAFGLLLCFL